MGHAADRRRNGGLAMHDPRAAYRDLFNSPACTIFSGRIVADIIVGARARKKAE
jgi:hypothetical protein